MDPPNLNWPKLILSEPALRALNEDFEHCCNEGDLIEWANEAFEGMGTGKGETKEAVALTIGRRVKGLKSRHFDPIFDEHFSESSEGLELALGYLGGITISESEF